MKMEKRNTMQRGVKWTHYWTKPRLRIQRKYQLGRGKMEAIHGVRNNGVGQSEMQPNLERTQQTKM